MRPTAGIPSMALSVSACEIGVTFIKSAATKPTIRARLKRASILSWFKFFIPKMLQAVCHPLSHRICLMVIDCECRTSRRGFEIIQETLEQCLKVIRRAVRRLEHIHSRSIHLWGRSSLEPQSGRQSVNTGPAAQSETLGLDTS